MYSNWPLRIKMHCPKPIIHVFTSMSLFSSFSDIVLLLCRASSQHIKGAVLSLFVKDNAAFRSSLHMTTAKHAIGLSKIKDAFQY